MGCLLVVFVAFTLGSSLLGFRTLISVNILSNQFPWFASGSHILGHQLCSGDTIDAGMPGISYTRSQLYSGHLGSWQGLVSGGSPNSSTPALGLLDPLSLPYFVLPLWLAPAFVKLFELVAAIGGMFLFLRRFDVSRAASLLAGLVFATSGFMVMWTNWPQTRVAALIPATFWAVERLVQRRRIADMLLIALIVASMLFGGFPSVTGWTLYAAGAYLIVRVAALHRDRLRLAAQTIALAAGGLVLGTMLTAVQLIPFGSFYGSSDLAYRANYAKGGLPLSGLVTLFVPDSNGLCVGGQTLVVGPINPIELVAYIGAAALVLAVAGAASAPIARSMQARGLRGYFVAAVCVVIVLGWVSPSARALIGGLPVFSGNFIGRIRSLLGFLLAVLAGLGFELLLRQRAKSAAAPRRGWWRRAWPVAVWLSAAATGLVLLSRLRRAQDSGADLSRLEHHMLLPAVLILVAVIAVFVARTRWPVLRWAAIVVVPVIVTAQAISFFRDVLPGDDPTLFYPRTPTHQFLSANLGQDRFAAAGAMYPSTALYYGLRTPTGHTFTDPRWKALLTAVDPKVMKSPTFSDFSSPQEMPPAKVASNPILDRMGVKYFVYDPTNVSGRLDTIPSGDGHVTATGGSISCQLPAEALRGVSVRLAQDLVATDPAKGVTLNIVTRAAGRELSSGRLLGAMVKAGGTITVGLAGEDLPTSGPPSTVDISASGSRGALSVASSNGTALCGALHPMNDNLRLVYAGTDSVVYQRLTALPRIRWATQSTVIANEAQRVVALANGSVPRDSVVFDSAQPAPSGQPANVTVGTDSGDRISARVVANGTGYLVVADAVQQDGWSVTVDGKLATLVPADEGMAAVAVPAGEHQIRFTYRAPGQVTGAVITAATLVIMAGLFVWDLRRRRASRDEKEFVPTQAAGAAWDRTVPEPAATLMGLTGT